MKRTQQLPGQSIVVHLSLSDTYRRKILIAFDALYSFTDVPSRISFHGLTNTAYSAQNARDLPVMYIYRAWTPNFAKRIKCASVPRLTITIHPWIV